MKNSELRRLWKRVQELTKKFKRASFISVPRTNIQIQKADALVNETLDRESSCNTGRLNF